MLVLALEKKRLVITLESVTVRYGADFFALRDLDLTVEHGECLALVGPSGSGKTSALRVINGLIPLHAGTVTVGGRDVRAWDLSVLRRSTGYVIQEAGLLPHWNVERNIATVPRMLGWNRARRQERASELITQVGLTTSDLLKYPAQLSGGQRQRVGIARALAGKPKWLLLDEPFGAIDPLTRVQLRKLLRTLQQGQALTTVLVTHDLEDAFELADRIALLRHGRLVQAGSKRELTASSDEWVREFLQAGRRATSRESR